MGVRFSHPQPKTAAEQAAVFSGHSAVGSAPRSGRGGRGFKSRCSDQKTHLSGCVFFCLYARGVPETAADTAKQGHLQAGKKFGLSQFTQKKENELCKLH